MSASTNASTTEGDLELGSGPVLSLLAVLTGLMFLAAAYLIFFHAPTEKVMGFVQKVFYFHVPSAWNMFLGVAVAAVGSVMYLVKRTDKWDRVGDAGVELAILFGTMVLISGPLWGRKAWGAFWVWDVRLTSSLVLVLTLVACKMVRGYAGAEAKKIAAGLAVFAVINSAFVYYSVDIWRGTHPPKLVATLEPAMKQTFWFSTLTYLLSFSVLLTLRLRLGKLQSSLDRLHLRLTESGIDD
jgi:heme exporter protein C